jgi:hypothetical protein
MGVGLVRPEYYQRGIDVNPQGPESGEMKVFRGGSWNEDPEVARSGGRNAGTPERKSYLTGLRCAKSEESPSVLSQPSTEADVARKMTIRHESRSTIDE